MSSTQIEFEAEARKIFDDADKDKNQTIDYIEFKGLLSKINPLIYKDEFTFFLFYGLVDSDGNGSIDYNEYLKLYTLLKSDLYNCQTFPGLCEILFKIRRLSYDTSCYRAVRDARHKNCSLRTYCPKSYFNMLYCHYYYVYRRLGIQK